MAEQSAAEKTEQPTPKRLEKAREKGQVPQSQELMSVVALVVLVAMVALLSSSLMNWVEVELREGMACNSSLFADTQTFLDFANRKTTGVLLAILPIVIALCVGSVAAGVGIGGLNFAPGAVELKFSQINPATGLAKLVNARSLVRLLMSIAKLIAVALIAWFYLYSKLEVLSGLRWAWPGQMLAVIAQIILGLMIRIGVALLLVGFVDVFYQKWKYKHDLKMTRQEVKQERKETEGSPEIKGRIRRIQFEAAARRMLQEVPKASVVLVNPTHVA
ncbi:MAG: EscU/YscU/HrcU family type III secretion system export apparatus switch protein, partial [Phycisphaerales bacterium]